MEPNYLEIGKRLQEARKSANMSQQDLANLMNVSSSYVKNTERGGKPSISYLFTVANNCSVSFDWLLTGTHTSLDLKQIPNSNEETEDLLDNLRNILNTADPDIRIWAKVQLQKMFGEYLPAKK